MKIVDLSSADHMHVCMYVSAVFDRLLIMYFYNFWARWFFLQEHILMEFVTLTLNFAITANAVYVCTTVL